MSTVINPVLPGFHPDPSAVRVGKKVYIANSTFEYYPGVKISSSENLVEWKTEAYPLNEERLLDMASQDSSSGVWAPCLSYAEGLFYLVYSNIRTFKLEGKEGIPFHDDYNYLITSSSIHGPWSDPVYLTGSGFDASLFHDDNGRKWLLYAKWSWRKEPGSEGEHSAGFYGIAMREYDPVKKRLTGEEKIIFKGTSRGLTEGPHLYKKDGYYYLLTAEGGTEYEHACTIARSRWIEGPYEVRPGNPHLLTSALNPGLSLQKAGHGALFTGFDGEWYLAHLCARPIKVDPKAPYSRGTSFSILGRETAIQPVEWIDGWPHIKGSESEPMESFEVVYPAIRGPVTDEQLDYDFSADTLSNDLMHLRIPMGEEVFSLKARTGWLRIYGKDSIVSRYRQSSLFRRQQWFECEAETCMSFSPDSFQQLAGLLYRYNESNQYYLYVSYDEKKKSKYLSLMMFDQGAYLNLLEEPVYFREDTVGLKIEVKGSDVRFAYSLAASGGWQWIEEAYSALKISDEYCWPGFTGAMFGISAQDFSGQNKHADFLHLKFQVYTENRE